MDKNISIRCVRGASNGKHCTCEKINKKGIDAGGKNRAYDECPFKPRIDDWDDDDSGIMAVLCEHCPYRDDCSEKDNYVKKDE